MKTNFYKVAVVDEVPRMIRAEKGDWVRREDHDRQVQGLVDQLAEKDKQLDVLKEKLVSGGTFEMSEKKIVVPEAIRDLLWQINNLENPNDDRVCGDHNLNVVEAYRRGFAAGRRESGGR